MRFPRLYLALALGTLLFLLAVGLAAPAAPAVPAKEPSIRIHPPTSPRGLLFIENAGQFAPEARFQVRGGPATLWLADEALWITVVDRVPVATSPDATRRGPHYAGGEPGRPRVVNVRLSFPQANPHPTIEPFGRQDSAVHYYRGNDPAGWHEHVPAWSGVRYRDLFPGADLELSGAGGQWAWRLVPQAGQRLDLQEVQLRVDGADGVAVDDHGLYLHTSAGSVGLPLLRVPEDGPGAPDPAAVSELQPGTFVVEAPCTTAAPASPAPHANPNALLYGTFLGGSGDDWTGNLAVDGAGAAYLTGYTYAPDFPTTPGAPDPSLGGDMDVFVSKIAPAGNGPADLVYSTFLGGNYANPHWSSAEVGYGIDVDGQGAAYIVGKTRAADFPTTPGAFDESFNGADPCPDYSPDVACTDGFVVKLNRSGGLAYGSYLGGSKYDVPDGTEFGGDDAVKGVVVRGGWVYLVGWTRSDDFPTTAGAYDREYADVEVGLNTDIFVAKMNLAGNGPADLRYSTYVGGGVHEYGEDLAVDDAGVVYATGYCDIFLAPVPCDFPTTEGAYDRTCAAPDPADVILFKLNPAGNGSADLLYGTLLGEEGRDYGNNVAVDNAGTAYVTGDTRSDTFPTTPGAFDRSLDGVTDAFISKLDPAGNGPADLLYSTYLGGSNTDNIFSGGDIVVGDNGDVYVSGDTASDDFPTTIDAFDRALTGSTDAFLARLRLQGAGQDDLIYSTFVGGNRADRANSIALGSATVVYLAGETDSPTLPTTPGAYDGSYNGEYDAFLTQLDITPAYLASGQVLDEAGQPMGGVVISAGGAYSTTTDAGGHYSLTLPAGTYRLTPSQEGCLFTPLCREVTVPPSAQGQDFAGDCAFDISGRVVGGRGDPLTGIQVVAGSTYSATTDADGTYTITDVPSGTYTLGPATAGYFWTPAQRTVDVPPDAGGQNFVGSHIWKQGQPEPARPVGYGQAITYTVEVVQPAGGAVIFYDAVPTHTAYVSGTLVAPTGIAYLSATGTISGPLSLSATQPATISFSVRVEVSGTVTTTHHFLNRACIHPAGGGLEDCLWSNEVVNFGYPWNVYLPLISR